MSKVAHYLQEHLSGEVVFSKDALDYYSTDSSIFTIKPSIIVYPEDEDDIRKTARFTWQLAERGRVVPITCRGSGSDKSGAAIGSGIIMNFPANMNRILEFYAKSGDVVVEPGISRTSLRQALVTHGRFIPPIEYRSGNSTIGGAVANNVGGPKAVKYGDIRHYTKALRVVLANGEVIETRRLSKRDLSKKLGLDSFEGDIYRAVDTLIEDNQDLVSKIELPVSRSSAGYALNQVKRKDGSFDLTPLIVGSQGTLGIITEVGLITEQHNPVSTVFLAFFDDMESVQEVIAKLQQLSDPPSAIELVDDNVLEYVYKSNPNQVKKTVKPPFAKYTVLIEVDSLAERTQKKMSKKISKLLSKLEIDFRISRNEADRDEYWRLLRTAVGVVTHKPNESSPLPVIDDGIVPLERLGDFMKATYELLDSNALSPMAWGSVGDGQIRVMPYFDISQVGDRQKMFRLMQEYYSMVIAMGGSTSSERGDGRIRGAFLDQLYEKKVYDLFVKVKQTFDPYNTLNPGVKLDVDLKDLRPLLRENYSVSHIYDQLLTP
jgi:FAD/FMN-containing dehydrogenase